jgi:hypothetical protein
MHSFFFIFIKKLTAERFEKGTVLYNVCFSRELILKLLLFKKSKNILDDNDNVLDTVPCSRNAKSVNILVPGAGLGRLAHEFARRGYNCQGNEWSLFMLLCSNFVLNK